MGFLGQTLPRGLIVTLIGCLCPWLWLACGLKIRVWIDSALRVPSHDSVPPCGMGSVNVCTQSVTCVPAGPSCSWELHPRPAPPPPKPHPQVMCSTHLTMSVRIFWCRQPHNPLRLVQVLLLHLLLNCTCTAQRLLSNLQAQHVLLKLTHLHGSIGPSNHTPAANLQSRIRKQPAVAHSWPASTRS